MNLNRESMLETYRPISGQTVNDLRTEERAHLLLIDSMVLFRASLSRILSAEPDFEIAGECGTPAEALTILQNSAGQVDLVLLDFDPGMKHANDFIPTARKCGYEGRFLIVAGSTDVRNSALALRMGASGIFLKSDQPQRLVQAIRIIMNGDIWVDRTIIQLLANQLIDIWPRSEPQISGDILGNKEKKVLMGIMQGLSNKRIGASLGISESSAKNIVQHLFTVTGVRTRSQLVRMAFEGTLGDLQKQPKSAEGEMPEIGERA